ncbi:MAG TPA: hypothetical protein EYN91_27605 [Candidatus Melainabacteria bacterium]|jgi:hypothetical protein|nr:hypothetical protein [Candidatus Melainabacteria bacterium]HIN66736.1 hypothetical protein [Candidatus Obscuribacterales bacterium]
MIRIQPLSISANGKDTYVVRFKRLASEHPECGVGPFEKPDGFVEYPFKLETLPDGFRSWSGPKQFDWDTHDDYTGAMWLRNSVLFLDLARIDGQKSHSDETGEPVEIIVSALNDNLEHTYLVGFESDGSAIQLPFVVSGDDQQLTIRWKENSYQASRGNQWKLIGKANSEPEENLVLAIAMLHAARNFIYGPDKERESSAT